MGYRSTFITDEKNLVLPQWFIKKWGWLIHTRDGDSLPIASKYEAKTYMTWVGIEDDLQKALSGSCHECIQIAFMVENGEVLRSDIFHDRIEGDYPTIKTTKTEEENSIVTRYYIQTHCAPNIEDEPWLAIPMKIAAEKLEGYDLSEKEKNEIPLLMAGYCRLLDEAGLLFYGMSKDEAEQETIKYIENIHNT